MKKKTEKSLQTNKITWWRTLSLALQLGYIIALPIAVLGFSGAYADKKFGTSPLFILIGILLAVAITSIGIYRKIKTILI